LHSYSDFLAWCRQAAVISQAEASVLERKAARRPGEAAGVHRRGLKLREAIYRIFRSIVWGESPALADLALLNSELATALGRLRVEPVRGDDQFALKWGTEGHPLDHPLGPVARAAAHLLTAPTARRRIRQCCGDNCGWLFLDSSKNRSRRWCDMRDCGNRAKVRRHRLKHRHT
jgi:predicted RNA-binding Zn ribbon-like protein